MPLNHYSKHNELTDLQLKLIGKLLVEFSNIDFLLGTLLTRILLTPSFLGRTYTDNLNVNSIIKAIKNGLDVHSYRYNNRFITELESNDIKTVLSKISKIQIKRNELAHECLFRHTDNSIFGTSFSGKVPTKIDAKGGGKILTNNELEALHKEAYNIVGVLSVIVKLIVEVDELDTIEKALKKKLSEILVNPTKPDKE